MSTTYDERERTVIALGSFRADGASGTPLKFVSVLNDQLLVLGPLLFAPHLSFVRPLELIRIFFEVFGVIDLVRSPQVFVLKLLLAHLLDLL